MKNLVIKRNVNFQELEETGIYSKELLQQIKEGNHKVLKSEVFAEQRKQENFMKPLLYAESNENKTYETYIYFEKSLQEKIANSEPELAIEIIKYKPELVKDTPISNNERVMFEAAQERPEVIEYMSSDLKHNKKFIEELSELDNTKITSYIEQECKTLKAIIDNPDLVNNFEFMKEAIKEDANALKYANENFKNDYNFIKELSKENKEVINYVVEHTDDFGKEALNGAKDSLEEKMLTETKKEVEDGRIKLETEKNKLTPEQIKRKERDLNSIDRMIKRFEDAETPEKKGRIAHVILVTTGMEQYQNMDKDFREELVKYEKLYIAANEKEKSKPQVVQEQTEKMTNTEVIPQKEGRDNFKIIPKQIEEKTEEVRISEINSETQNIREEYSRQTEEKEVEINDRGTI